MAAAAATSCRPVPVEIEDDDFLRRAPSGPCAGDHFGQLAMHIRFRHDTGFDGVVEVAHRRTLGGEVGNDRGGGHQLGRNLALVRVVRPDRSNEGAGGDEVGI